MDVQVEDRPTCHVVQPSGQLDMDSAPRLRSVLEGLIDAGRTRIVIDLGRLTFCDSIGLSTLVVASRGCEATGGFLRLARPNPFLLNLLTVVGVREAVRTYDSVEAACR